MIKISQNSFLAGQLDFEMMGRQDFKKYQKGASKLVNFNILKRGGITKRQGFDRIVDLGTLNDGNGNPITESTKKRIIPFGYKKNHGFIMLFVPGACYAICTVKGSIYKCWSVPYSGQSGAKSPFGTYAGTDNEINEFDYVQCGYRLYLAHSKHAPSFIYTTEAMVDAAINNQSLLSPFIWQCLDTGSIEYGIPSITGCSQSRIAPSADTAGGTFVEKYKVSATFDSVETKPCSEFYNESCINPVAIGETSGGTLVSRSTSTTSGYTSTTSGSSGGQATTSTTRMPTVTNNSSTYSNKVSANCTGTKYYLPWVESMSIKLNIQVSKKNGMYPDHVNVYKKNYGYYGLIGTIDTSRSFSNITKTITTSALSVDSEKVSASSSERQYDAATSIDVQYTDSIDNLGNVHRTAKSVTKNAIATISPSTAISNASVMRLFIGKVKIEFTAWEKRIDETTSTEVDDYTRPKAMTLSWLPITSSGIAATATYKYMNAGGSWSGNQTTTKTFTDITSGTVESQSYSYDTFSELNEAMSSNINSFYSEIANKGTEMYDLRMSEFSHLGNEIKIQSIVIKPNDDNTSIPIAGICINGIAADGILTVSFTDNNITPNSAITPIDDDFETPFSSAGNYPSTVCISQQRLIWGSSDNQPETIWMSAIGDFSNYVEHEIQKDDDSIEFDIPVTRFAKMNHLVEMRQLLAFNSACEWLISTTSTVKGLTYETIQARPQSYSGSNARLKPLICNNSVVFSERTGQAVRRFSYDIANDGFAGRDVSVLSSSIFERNSIVDWTYQQHPFSMVWCVLSDGQAASFTFMEEQEIMAWATHKHGGGRFKNFATSYAMSPSLSEIQDQQDADKSYELATHEEVFAIVATDSGLWLERMRVRSKENDTVYNSLCLDSVRVLNESVSPLSDSNLVYIDSIDGKRITRTQADMTRLSRQVYEGYPFDAVFTSVYPILGNTVGQGQFDIKNVSNIGIRLEASCGGTVESAGKPEDVEPIRYNDEAGEDKSPIIAAGNVKLFNLNVSNIKPIGANVRDGRITIKQSEVFPFTIISFEADYATEQEGDYGRVR